MYPTEKSTHPVEAAYNITIMGVTVSRYTQAWNTLKESGKLTLAVPPKLHKRLIKAIIKRKYEDNGYRLLLAEKNKKAIISYESEQSRLRFWLRIYDNLNGISGGDL